MARRFSFGPFLLDTARGTLTRDGSAVAVGQRALRILQALLEAGGEPVTKAALMAQAWPGLVVEDSNLSVQVTALRKALATAGVDGEAGIVTVPRLGYRLPGAVRWRWRNRSSHRWTTAPWTTAGGRASRCCPSRTWATTRHRSIWPTASPKP